MAVWADDDLGIEHPLAAGLLLLVLLAPRFGQVMDANKDGDRELLGQLLQADLRASCERLARVARGKLQQVKG